jgi:hypothetical protein
MKRRMEPRKYSTGTKGRLKMHADQCREFIHANSPDFHLANEFIETVDPEREDRVWQRFQSPEDILPELQAWLDGDPTPPAPATLKASAPLPTNLSSIPAKLAPASTLLGKAPSGDKNSSLTSETKMESALKKTRAWVEEESVRLNALPPLEAVEETLRKISEIYQSNQART